MRRVRDNKYGYRSWTAEELKRFGKFLILPLIVVILVVVILAWDRKPEEERQAAAETSAEQETTGESAETEPVETEAPVSHEFTTEGNPEIQEMMNRYFTAKQNADVETIYQLFGWTDTSSMEALRGRLQYDARYTEGYRNILCYTKPGLDAGTYMVYVSYDLKFKNSLTLAPGLLWNYVKTGEDGALHLTDTADLSQEELDFVSAAEATEEIVLLKTQIYAKLRLALEEDADLAESYGILEKQGGSSGGNQGETTHEVTVQIGGGDEENSESAEGESGDVEILTDGAEGESGSEVPAEAGSEAPAETTETAGAGSEAPAETTEAAEAESGAPAETAGQ